MFFIHNRTNLHINVPLHAKFKGNGRLSCTINTVDTDDLLMQVSIYFSWNTLNSEVEGYINLQNYPCCSMQFWQCCQWTCFIYQNVMIFVADNCFPNNDFWTDLKRCQCRTSRRPGGCSWMGNHVSIKCHVRTLEKMVTGTVLNNCIDPVRCVEQLSSIHVTLHVVCHRLRILLLW